MRDVAAALGAWFKGKRRGPHDLAALALMVLLAVSIAALDEGSLGLRVVRTVLVGILAVLVLAAADRGGWFKK